MATAEEEVALELGRAVEVSLVAPAMAADMVDRLC
jgi:hypothetical protein